MEIPCKLLSIGLCTTHRANLKQARGIYTPSSQVALNALISSHEHLVVFFFTKEDIRLQQVFIERVHACTQATLLANPLTSLDVHHIA